MKATQRDFAAKAAQAAQSARLFFFCGQDEAGASAAAEKIVSQLGDSGERIDMIGSDIRKDPVLLGDEARSTSLFGETRHILVRAQGDEAHAALQILTEAIDREGAEPCPVLVVATAATDKSRTAKLLEKRKDALVAMFYPPDLASVTASVRQMADAAGLRLNGDIAERIARASGLDVRLARSEVEKLATYCDASAQAPKPADAGDLAAIGAATEDDGFMPLVNAVLSGETGKLPGEIQRMRELGLNPVGLLLAFERRAAQLGQLAPKVSGGNIKGVLEEEKRARRIFWKDERDIATQLRRWQGKRLERLLVRLADLHRQLMANNQGAEIMLAQGLADIARAAAPRR